MRKKPDIGARSLALHKKLGGKIELAAKGKLKTREDWSLFYTPGVGAVSTHLGKHPKDARIYTIKRNTVAVVSNGTAVLGLGDIGPYAALPVMEGKALIFKDRAGVDAFPIVLDTKDPDEVIETVMRIAPGFGGINLEDIKAPECFYIEEELKKRLDIPVMHDDQHGTAIVVLAGLINAMKVTKRTLEKTRIVVNGVGAAGVATMRLIKKYAPGAQIIAVDSLGIVRKGRDGLSESKRKLTSEKIIVSGEKGYLEDALRGADIFIGVSKAGALRPEHIALMSKRPVIFALANPVPEIMPGEAKRAGAAVVATGRSDFPNQVNNALVFPGIFRGALDKGVTQITDETKLAAAKALAALVKKPTAENIIPSVLDARVAKAVAKAVH